MRLTIRLGRAHADVGGARDAEHVEQIGREHVEAEAREAIGVDLVVGGDAVGVVDHENARPLAGPFRLSHVAGDAVLLLGEHSRDDVHARSLTETRQWMRSSSGG